MARSSTTIELIRRRQRYIWPQIPINIWIIIMLVSAGVLIGIYANFIIIQTHFEVGIPWIFPFGIAVGALTVVFIIVHIILIAQDRLLPAIVIVLSIILFALYLTGTIETAIQLFSASGNVNANCQNYILGNPIYGQSVDTLAWLEQYGICQSWYAVFSFWIIGAVFLIWIIVIAVSAIRNQVDS